MDRWKCAQNIMTLLRQLYLEDPGAFETEMQGADDYTNARVQKAIEKLLREHE